MHITGLDFLFFEVNNLEESVAFYAGLLGFEVSKHSPESEPPLATLQAGGLKVGEALITGDYNYNDIPILELL